MFPARPLKWGGTIHPKTPLDSRLADESIRLVLTPSADGFTKRLAWYVPGEDGDAIITNLLTTRPSAFIME
jgi:hypothetical protein